MHFFRKLNPFVDTTAPKTRKKQQVEIRSFFQLVRLSEDLKALFLDEIKKLESQQEQLLAAENYEALAKIKKLKEQYLSLYENPALKKRTKTQTR